MESLKLTVSFVKKLVPGPPERYADTEVPGLQVRVMPKKVCYYFSKRYNYKLHEFALGSHPDITLEEARQMAIDRLGALANHSEIQSVSSRRQPLVREAIAAWLEKQKYPQHTAPAMKYWTHLSDKKIADLVPSDIQSVFDAMFDTPSMANHCVRYLKTAFNQMFKKLRMENPVPFLFDDIKPYPTAPRMRVMREDEAPKIIAALKDKMSSPMYADQAAAILVMIYTGQRKSRVLGITGAQIDIERRIWHVPGNNIKRPVELSLNDFAWEIIAPRLAIYSNEALFYWRGKQLKECKKTMATVCRECGIEDLHIHDLRRSLGSWMISSGASIEEVSKTLGHSSIRITEQVYAHLLPDRGRDATTTAIAAMLKGKV
jgi:integrase